MTCAITIIVNTPHNKNEYDLWYIEDSGSHDITDHNVKQHTFTSGNTIITKDIEYIDTLIP